MSEFDDDARVRLAFSEFRYGGIRHVKPAGVSAAQATVRRRRQARAATLSVVAALFIGVPVAAYAVQRNQGTGPNPTTTPTETLSPSLSPEPSASPSSSPSASAPSPDAPQLTKDEIRNGTFVVPTWPADGNMGGDCRQGSLKFTNGSGAKQGDALKLEIAEDIAYSDVDRDGGKEAVVKLSCFYQGGVSQVIVVDRDPAGGIRTVGQVVATTGQIKAVYRAEGTAEGSIRVEVGDSSPCCGGERFSQHQWRTYAFVGGEFRQTGGPTTFPPNPKLADIVVTTSDLAFGPANGGTRTGEITVRVKNNGPARAREVSVYLELPLDVERTGTGWASCEPDYVPPPPVNNSKNVNCTLGAMASGESKTLTFQMTAPSDVASRNVLMIAAFDIDGLDLVDNNQVHPRITVKD